MKAILVLDMPERCGECQFMDDDCLGGYCNAHDDDYIDIPDTMGGKPDWCPLRPLPEPMEVCGKYPQLGKPMPSYRVGWNACLDKIMGNQDLREVNTMFDKSKCKECLCNTCIYDYGLACSSFSCLCKDRAYMGCDDCKGKDSDIVRACDYYIPQD